MKTKNPSWQRLRFPVLPPPRIGSSMVLNAKNKTLMLFGGITLAEGNLNDFWVMNRGRWEPIEALTLPPSRSLASLAYDKARDRTVLFGGVNGNAELLGDTWSFDGFQWTHHQALSAPPPRANASIAYDAARNMIVLFGGEVTKDRLVEQLNDTWIWDGVNWMQHPSDYSPPARSGGALIYDGARQNVILFGGGSGGGFRDDTWTWDGSSWVEQRPLQRPVARSNAGIVFHEGRQEIIVFGGQTSEGVINDTWVWNGHDWFQLELEVSPPVEMAYFPNLAYDPNQQVVLLYNALRQKTAVVSGGSTFTAHSEVWALTY